MAGRVVLVESDEQLRTSIVKALRARGVGVDAFALPSDMLRALERGAVWSRGLFALEQEGTDGATLASTALTRLPDLDVIFLTGSADASVLARAHALGTVIWKPVGLGLLSERLTAPQRRSGVVRRAGEAPVERKAGEG